MKTGAYESDVELNSGNRDSSVQRGELLQRRNGTA
jgi:hypothetical protein